MKLKKNDNDNILGNKLKPAMKLIDGLNRGEFEQLIDGLRLLFDGVQEFKARAPRTEDIEYNPYAIKVSHDDIDEADEALTLEMKKAKKPKKKK